MEDYSGLIDVITLAPVTGVAYINFELKYYSPFVICIAGCRISPYPGKGIEQKTQAARKELGELLLSCGKFVAWSDGEDEGRLRASVGFATELEARRALGLNLVRVTGGVLNVTSRVYSTGPCSTVRYINASWLAPEAFEAGKLAGEVRKLCQGVALRTPPNPANPTVNWMPFDPQQHPIPEPWGAPLRRQKAGALLHERPSRIAADQLAASVQERCGVRVRADGTYRFDNEVDRQRAIQWMALHFQAQRREDIPWPEPAPVPNSFSHLNLPKRGPPPPIITKMIELRERRTWLRKRGAPADQMLWPVGYEGDDLMQQYANNQPSSPK